MGFLKALAPENQNEFEVVAREVDEIGYESVEGEFWTSAQRQAANLHEVSYRACFKPQLPGFFIQRFAEPGDLIYDPFSGRGTTAIEAALTGHRIATNDINPLTTYLTKPRIELPGMSQVSERLEGISRGGGILSDLDLSMFYEEGTLQEILGLRQYLYSREQNGESDSVDRWIRMVATNRLTGHSPGFFSVYSMPPNQAVSQISQLRINEKRNQIPTYRDTHALILKKSKQLQNGLSQTQVTNLRSASKSAIYLNSDAAATPELEENSVQLTVTSPPFLDVVQYSDDNWLRGWFNSIDMDAVASKITMSKTIEAWNLKMLDVFRELYRVTKPGGFVAFEVGEVRNGKVKLEEAVVPVGVKAGFKCLGALINTQEFTKTSNIWGISNNSRGTNSNRVVVFQK